MMVLKLMSIGFIIVSLFLQNVNGNHYLASKKMYKRKPPLTVFLSFPGHEEMRNH